MTFIEFLKICFFFEFRLNSKKAKQINIKNLRVKGIKKTKFIILPPNPKEKNKVS